MQKWFCTICGYLHEGTNPPDRCPFCGAPKEKYIAMDMVADEEATRALESYVARIRPDEDVKNPNSGVARNMRKAAMMVLFRKGLVSWPE